MLGQLPFSCSINSIKLWPYIRYACVSKPGSMLTLFTDGSLLTEKQKSLRMQAFYNYYWSLSLRLQHYFKAVILLVAEDVVAVGGL